MSFIFVIASNHRALSCDQCTLWCHMKCGQVKLREYKRLQQMDQFNWICPACFLTALPFADASILSDEGEYYAQTLNTSNLSNTSANSLPEFIKSRNDDDREILIMHLNINGIQNKFEEVKQLMKEFKAQVFFLIQKQKLTQLTLLLSSKSGAMTSTAMTVPRVVVVLWHLYPREHHSRN